MSNTSQTYKYIRIKSQISLWLLNDIVLPTVGNPKTNDLT